MSLLASAMRSPGAHIAVFRGGTGPGAFRRQLACRDPHWTLWSTAVVPPLQTAWRMPPAGTPVTASVTESESLDQPLGLTGAFGPVAIGTRDLLGDPGRDEAEQRGAPGEAGSTIASHA